MNLENPPNYFSQSRIVPKPKEEPMNRKFLFVTIGVVAMLLVATFWAGNAFANTGCFSDTNGHWAETYICWLKDHHITFGYGDGTYRPENAITRGEMAAMLQRQAEVPPSTGLITITPGNGDWVKMLASDDVFFDNYSNLTNVVKATAGDAYISVQPSVPTVLYGRIVQLVGVNFCYTASTNTYLSEIEIDEVTASPGGTSGTHLAIDYTDRTDSACRYYVLAAPVNLTPFDSVEFFIVIHWNAGGTVFSLGRTTFALQPTDIVAPLIPLSDPLMPLSIMDATGEVPGTSAP